MTGVLTGWDVGGRIGVSENQRNEDKEMEDEWLNDYVKEKFVVAIMGIFGVSRMVATMYLEHHNYSLDKTVEDLREQTGNDN